MRRKTTGALILVAIIFASVLVWSFANNQTNYNSGLEQGKTIGYQDGYSVGNGTGYQAGYYAGWMDGNNTGYGEGNLDGHQQGFVDGYANGNQSGFTLGVQNGYSQGLKDGAGTGYDIRDPSYQEMKTFMSTDTIHNNVYSSSYICWNFASDFADEAFNAGYRCGFVYMTFADNTSHAIDCFNTADKGLFFIEPQADEIVQLTVGQIYQPAGYEPSGTVSAYGIVW